MMFRAVGGVILLAMTLDVLQRPEFGRQPQRSLFGRSRSSPAVPAQHHLGFDIPNCSSIHQQTRP